MQRGTTRAALLAVVAVAASLLTAPAGASARAFPGANGRIAWVAGPSGSTDLWVMDANGANKRNLTGSPADIDHPSVAPDGSEVAYEKGSEVWTVNVDGTQGHRVSPQGATRSNPTWSPTGDELAWDDGARIRVLDVDAGTESLLRDQDQFSGGGCSHTVSYVRPRWSPAGDHLVATRLTDPPTADCDAVDPQRDLVLVAVPGGAVTVLTNDDTLDDFADWHPNGTSIVFQRGDQSTGFFGISKMPPTAGGTITPLQADVGAQPRFSPDGTKVLFVRDNDGQGTSDGKFDLWTMSPTGAGMQVLLTNTASNKAPDWGPQGAKVFTVNVNTDNKDAQEGDGRCDSDKDKPGLQCSLRAAIQEANKRSGPDEIQFKLKASPPTGLRIALKAALPVITDAVKIDGTTQPDTAINKLLVAVTGTEVPAVTGFTVRGQGTEIRGLMIRNFRKGSGISLQGQGGHTVAGNWFGFQPEGATFSAQPNLVSVELASPGDTVGGGTVADKNVFGASGDFPGLRDLAGGLDREGSKPEQVFAGAIRDLGAGVLVGNNASNTTIQGNTFGRDPKNERLDNSGGLDFGAAKFGNVVGILVAPETGGISNVQIGGDEAIRRNTLSGNMWGILAAPLGTVSNLRVHGNLIGPKGPALASAEFGNVVGIAVGDKVSGLRLGGAGAASRNSIQGNLIGVVVGRGATGATIQNNAIGRDGSLKDLVDDLARETPSIGLPNFIGVILGDTTGVQFGGGAGLGNDVLGNLIGMIVGGQQSQDNVIAGNTFGRSTPGTGNPGWTGDGLGSIVGILEANSTNNTIGAAGAGNKFYRNALAVISADTTDGKFQANTLEGNSIGLLVAGPAGMAVGGTAAGQGNTFRRSAIGLLMAHREPTADEREASNTNRPPVSKSDRQQPMTSDNTDLALDSSAPLTGSVDLSAAGVVIKPPEPGTNNKIQGNLFGDPASTGMGNWVGAWLLGDLTETTFGTGAASLTAGANTVAHNSVAGVWVGPPIRGESKIDLRGNSIYENHSFAGPSRGIQGLGIDLLPPAAVDSGQLAVQFGVSPNDPTDADKGGNGRQNYPVLSTVEGAGGNDVHVVGTLQSKPNTTYSIELYSSTNCGKFAFGEGQTLIKRFDVLTNGSGAASIDTTATMAGGQPKIASTATGPDGTSEFSHCETVA